MLGSKDDDRVVETLDSAFGPNRGLDSSEPRSGVARRTRSRDLNRTLSQRVSRGHVFGLLLGLIGFTTTWFLIGDEEPEVEVYFAGVELAGGQEIEPSSLRAVEVEADSPLVGLGVKVGDDDQRWYTTGPVEAGDPILATDVASTPTADGLVEVAVESEFSIGDVSVGDRVGVAAVVSQSSLATASWLAVDARVTAVGGADTGSGLVTTAAESSVTVAVTPPQALALAAGHEAGSLAIISTGLDAEIIDTDDRIVVSLENVGRPVATPSGGSDDG